jgi:glycine/D-amino acid oxidase-like deaminating enzyme
VPRAHARGRSTGRCHRGRRGRLRGRACARAARRARRAARGRADLALGASGANSGILHTGFDSTPGELETRLILRAAALREELLDELGVTVWRCGARLTPSGADERAAVTRWRENARSNGVEAGSTPGRLADAFPASRVVDPSPSCARSPARRRRAARS